MPGTHPLWKISICPFSVAPKITFFQSFSITEIVNNELFDSLCHAQFKLGSLSHCSLKTNLWIITINGLSDLMVNTQSPLYI